MAVDYSALNLCPEKIGDLYASYIADQNWFERVMSKTGISGDEVKFVHMDVGGNLIPCCTKGDGTDTFEEVVAPIQCIKLEKRYCKRDLQKVDGIGISNAATSESLGRIGERIANATVKRFANLLTDLAFNGGTVDSDPSDPNRQFTLAGYMDLATDATPGGTPITTGTIFDVINTAYYALPYGAFAYSGTIGIFVGQEVMPVYSQVLQSRNYFHYNPTDFQYGKEEMLPGVANVVVIPVSALNGTNKVLVTPLENMYWLTNKVADKETYAWKYDAGDDEYILRIESLFGVAFVYPEYAITVEYDPQVLTRTRQALGVAIVEPIDAATGGVITA